MAIALSGSLVITGSIFATQGITGSFSGNATSASYATTASYALRTAGVNSLTASTVIYIDYNSSTGGATIYNQGVVSITGSANQIASSPPTTQGLVTLFLPQGIGTTSQVTFGGITGSVLGTASNATLFNTRDSSTFANTGSNTFTGPQYVSQASNAISFTSTASLYTDGGLRVAKDSFVSGTAYFNNVVVYGTSSIQYITSSQVNFGTNIITVNTDTPAVRFGGLAVFDSGSTQLTGSILWDSEKNHWIYSNPSGSTYNSAMLMNGPRNTGSLGTEQGTLNNYVMKGQGGDHITSSQIIDDGTTVQIPGNLQVTGSLSGSSAVFSLTVNATNGLLIGNGGAPATSGYVPKFTGTSTIGNSTIVNDGTTTFINTTSGSVPPSLFVLQNAGANPHIRGISLYNQSSVGDGTEYISISHFAALKGQIQVGNATVAGSLLLNPLGGNVLIGTTTDDSYKLDVNGTGRFTNGVNMATTTGNVGIGTVSPQATYKVTISGTDTIYPAIYLENTTNTQAYSIRATGTNFVVRDNTSGNDRLTLASTGAATFSGDLYVNGTNKNLQVGNITIPTTDSGIRHIFAGSGVFLGQDGVGELNIGNNFYFNSAFLRRNTDAVSNIRFNAGLIYLQVAASGAANSAITWTNAVTIANSGNVGIGISPTEKLHIYGTGANTQTILQESSTSAANAYLVQKSTSKSYITGLSTDFSNSYIIYDATAAAARLVVTTGGNVGIGTDSPNAKLSILGASNTPTSYGSLLVKNSSEGGISFGASGTSYAWIQGNIYGASYNFNLALNAQGGNVLIGTTTDDTINKLQVSGGIYSSNYNTNFNSVTINSSTNVNTAVLDIGIVCFRDAVNGGGCLVFYENGQTPVIVSQSGGTTFTTSSPSATEIQISNRSGSRGLQALGGSSRNSVQLIWSVFRITGLSA